MIMSEAKPGQSIFLNKYIFLKLELRAPVQAHKLYFKTATKNKQL